MIKTKELVVVDFKEFGIEESKAQQIAEQFKPMLDKMVELEIEANAVFKLGQDDMEASKKAKEVRLKYVKVRTGTAEIHKEQKSFYLQAGRFVDGWKNAQLFASQGIEEKLETIEKFAENKENERLEKLQELRVALISEFVDDTIGLDLGNMQDDVFDAYLSAKKQAKADKVEAQRVAEENRIKEIESENERKRLEAIENERVRQENEVLRKEAEAKELAIQKERQENEIKAKEEKAKQNATLEAERETQAKILAEEKAKSEKLQYDLKVKQDAEANSEAERLAEIERKKKEAEKLAKSSVKAQLNNWIETFQTEIPETLKNDEIANKIVTKFWDFKKWASDEIKSIE